MSRNLSWTNLQLIWSLAALVGFPAVACFAQEKISTDHFESKVWPVFQTHCIDCHGSDTAEGQLRLDAKAAFFEGGVSGQLVDVQRPEESLLIQRLRGHGDADQMPLDAPALDEDAVHSIKKWIEAGAQWPDNVGVQIKARAKHWAYLAPQRATPPVSVTASWANHVIDAWTLEGMVNHQLEPSPVASKDKLLRRMHLDLLGLPPTPEHVDEFIADRRPDAVERELDRLLASPHYGQRWARPWLDMARYADSNGYQADQYREVWSYRDWVVSAFNADMPFDQFTIEQLAGDLLPGSTVDQRVATGFHRLTTCNVEAGVDPEENRVNQVLDRVNTTATVWLGSTLECCQCHSHKYDPFSQKEYYQLFAYFNNTPLEVKDSGNNIQYEFIGPKMDLPLPDETRKRRTALKANMAQLSSEISDQQKTLLVHYRDSASEAKSQRQAEEGEDLAPASDPTENSVTESTERNGPEIEVPEELRPLIAKPYEKLNAAQKKKVRSFLTSRHADYKTKVDLLSQAEKEFNALDPNTTLVMIEQPMARETRVFKRGEFLNPGEPVQPGTPRILHPQQKSRPANRLGLAQWIVDPQNPLTARVTVNRWWGEIFGRPLAVTAEDFGTQGEPSSHPEILDWMALELQRNQWSMKSIHRQFLLSSTYRQSSITQPQHGRIDPTNRWLARANRYRLSAETLRDNALAVAGVLTSHQGGPPVYPPQPANVWRHVGRNAPVYKTSQGADRYRRGLYVFWRRSAPYPSFVNFDAPDRASCTVKRDRTNTPLQALTLLNDVAYLELAGHLANQILHQFPVAEDGDRLKHAFRQCVSRQPTEAELAILIEHLEAQRDFYSHQPQQAKKLATYRQQKTGSAVEFAAWMVVASTLMNLDETICRD